MVIMATKDNSDKIEVKRKGGGCLFNKPPIFSADGKRIYIESNNIIECYSVETGEKLKDFTEHDTNIVDFGLYSNLLVSCSEEGEITVWQSDILLSTNILQCDYYGINSFHLIEDETNENCQLLIGYYYNQDNHVGIFSLEKLELIKKLNVSSNLKFKSIAHSSQMVAVMYEHEVQCTRLHGIDKVFKLLSGKTRSFTCITCHPEAQIVVTGDSQGRIVVWNNVLTKNKSFAVYHWHQLPVNTINFSESGTVLYSGADECVMVKWELDTLTKTFLPRLPASIVHIRNSPANVYIAISIKNNAIHIVDTHFKPIQVIQQLSCTSLKETGLNYDPRTKALVYNSYVGNIQFYSPDTQSMLYNLEIIGQNKLTDERNIRIPNTIITKLALTKQGDWLACVEERKDGDYYQEIRLKFFQFDDKTQKFVLNTSIEFPHENGVNALEFQPTSSSTDILCATTGNDKMFKIWALVDTTDIYRKSRAWRACSSSYYKDEPVHALAFSFDGSLLAVTFGSILTVWKPDTCELKCSLVHPMHKVPLNIVKFGNVDQCHFVLTTSKCMLFVWNLLTLALVWTVNIRINHLCNDPLSTYIAAITDENGLYIFTPNSPTPVYYNKTLIGGNKIVGAVFIPHKLDKIDGLFWQKLSQLYFIDSKQELFCLQSPNERTRDIAMEYTPETERTPFSSMLAETVTTNKRTQSNLNNPTEKGLVGAMEIKELLVPPVHTMAPMRRLCKAILSSMIIKDKNETETADRENNDSSDDEAVANNSDDESDIEIVPAPKPIKSSIAPAPIPNISEKTIQSILSENVSWTSVLVNNNKT